MIAGRIQDFVHIMIIMNAVNGVKINVLNANIEIIILIVC
ncbi:hypothetical protein SDC9_157497 [bioreactor metagenome]|uniref:Uncharacterized protein n=1 Tax=bioreactor metagenome TaxID=1076179 RepID=A0A645F9H1_9ZZZZ